MRIKHFLPLITLFFISIAGFNQAREKDTEEPMEYQSFKERLYTGGNLSMSFGTFTYVDIAPIVGYRVTEDFSVGLGGKYVYIGYNSTPRTSTSIYGGSIFSRYLFLENFLAHAEFQGLNVEVRETFTGQIKRKLVPISLVGGGYKQSLGGSSYMQIMLLYDVIGDKNSPYQGTSPFGITSRLYISAGITIGL
jgi:hypothetical protein